MEDRYRAAEWLEMSGLPAELNALRRDAWLVFKKLVELDCRRHATPEAVEISLGELAARCGIEWEKAAKIAEALQKKKHLACFIPDNPDEEGLFQIRVPVQTPVAPAEVAAASEDPGLRDPTAFRYLAEPEDAGRVEQKVQAVADMYLNALSWKMNSFIVDQIEVLVRRFPLEDIEKTIQRAAQHEIRSLGWVIKELIRDRKKARKSGDA